MTALLRAAVLVGALAGAATSAQAAYRDVPRQHWAFEEVEWVRANGVMAAKSGGLFRGDEGMTRFEMAHALTGYMKSYYAERDEIDAELRDLRATGTRQSEQLEQIERQTRDIEAQVSSGARPVRPAPPAPSASPAQPDAGPSGEARELPDRYRALLEKIRASRHQRR